MSGVSPHLGDFATISRRKCKSYRTLKCSLHNRVRVHLLFVYLLSVGRFLITRQYERDSGLEIRNYERLSHFIEDLTTFKGCDHVSLCDWKLLELCMLFITTLFWNETETTVVMERFELSFSNMSPYPSMVITCNNLASHLSADDHPPSDCFNIFRVNVTLFSPSFHSRQLQPMILTPPSEYRQ